MPKAFSRRVEASELETAPLIWSFMLANASMKWFTVEPVPTPTNFTGHHVFQGSLAHQGFEFFLRHRVRSGSFKRKGFRV